MLAGGYGGTDTRIEYVEIPTTGNAKTFGDLMRGGFGRSGTGSPITGLFASGTSGSTRIEKITLATFGNSSDLGDLVEAATYGRGMSSSHGGL